MSLKLELPGKLNINDSLFVSFTKWCLLLLGNFFCVRSEKAVSIFNAIHDKMDKAKMIDEWVGLLVKKIAAMNGQSLDAVNTAWRSIWQRKQRTEA